MTKVDVVISGPSGSRVYRVMSESVTEEKLRTVLGCQIEAGCALVDAVFHHEDFERRSDDLDA